MENVEGGHQGVILENDSWHKPSHVLWSFNNSWVLMCSNPSCLAPKKTKPFFPGGKKQESKIAGNVISSQKGRSLGSRLKVPRASAEPIRKASDFHLLHFLQNYHPEPCSLAQMDKRKYLINTTKTWETSEMQRNLHSLLVGIKSSVANFRGQFGSSPKC